MLFSDNRYSSLRKLSSVGKSAAAHLNAGPQLQDPMWKVSVANAQLQHFGRTPIARSGCTGVSMPGCCVEGTVSVVA